MPQSPEHVEQVLFFQRVALDWRTRDLLITAIPNGGMRNVVVAKKLKAEGVKKGVPDILCFAHGWGSKGQPCNGLAIEMKRPEVRNRPSAVKPDQRAWLQALLEEGWDTCVCYSAEEAFDRLAQYRGFVP